jgi:hypothetical protein
MRILLLALVACTSPGPKGQGAGANDTGDANGDDDSADDGADDTSADDTADPTPIVVQGQVATERFTDLPQGLWVSAVPVEFGRGPLLHPAAASGPVDSEGRFTLTLPTQPLLSDQYEVGEFQPLDVSGATLVLFLHASDGDAYAEYDPILGLALDQMLVWLDGTAPDHDWPAGWSVVDSGMAGTYDGGRCLSDTRLPLQWRSESAYPSFDPIEGTTLTLALPGAAADLDVSATVAPLPEGVDRLAALPYDVVFAGAESPEPAWDTALSEGALAWSPTAIPPDEADVTQSPYWRYALYVPLTYMDGGPDGEADGGWTPDDTPDGGTFCSADGDRVMLRYSRPVTNWQGYKLMECQGGTVGWRVVSRTDAGLWSGYLDGADGNALVVNAETCSW